MESLLQELKATRQEITVIPNDFNGRYDEAAETAFRGLLKKCDALLARIEPVVSQFLYLHKEACRVLEEARLASSKLMTEADDYTLAVEARLRKQEERLTDRELAVTYRLAEAESREAAAVEELNRVSARAISLGGDYKKRVDEFEVDYKNRCETVSNLLSNELKRLSAKERGLEAQYLSQTKAELANLRAEYDEMFASVERVVVAKLSGREELISKRETEQKEFAKHLSAERQRIHEQYQLRANELVNQFSKHRKREEGESRLIKEAYDRKFSEIDNERQRLARVARDFEVEYSGRFTRLSQLEAKK